MSMPNPPDAYRGGLTVHFVHAGNPFSSDPDGIVSVQRNFVSGAPSDLRFIYWGVDRPDAVSAPAEDGRLVYRRVTSSPVQRPRVPLALRFSTRVALRPPEPGPGGVLRFDRIEPATAMLRSRGPKVLFLHHGPLRDLLGASSDSRWRWVRPAYRAALRRVVRGVDQVYLLAGGLREELLEESGVSPERVRLFRVPVDTVLFRPLPETGRQAVREELAGQAGVPMSARLVVFAGRLERIKRPRLMVEAVRALSTSVDDEVHVVVAGTGSLRASVEVDAARLAPGRVHLLGSISQAGVARLLGAADALLLTSASEASPNVVLEALASGCPVVVTGDAEGAVRLVRPGVTGAVCDPEPARIADGLKDVLSWRGFADACRQAGLEAAPGPVNAPLYARFRELAAEDSARSGRLEPWLLPVGERS
jgi:glycosyltransferase involved in cell wall biosynthesis